MASIRKAIGDLLVDNGQITPEELEQAEAEKVKTGEPIAAVLAKLGLVTENSLKNALELQYGVNYVNLSKNEPEHELIALLPEAVIRAQLAVPVSQQGERLTIAMVDPSDSAAVDEVKKKLAGRQVKTVVCLEEEFVKFVNKAFAVVPKSDNGSVTTADDSSKSENGSVETAKSENGSVGSVATADDSSKPENGSVSLEESSKSENAVKAVDNGITETESDVKHGEATAKEGEPEKTEVKSPAAASESIGNGSTTAAIKPLYNEPEIYSTQEMKARPAPTSFPAEKEVNPDSISELDLARRAQEEAIVLLANQILGSAIKRHCSNIHISMGARESVVHYRLNGRLLVDRKLPNTVVTALVARYKMMARLNLAERIEPQDGHIKVKSASKEIVCLISVVPNDHGESIVIWIV